MRKNEATSQVCRVLGSCLQAQDCCLPDDMHILCSSRMNVRVLLRSAGFDGSASAEELGYLLSSAGSGRLGTNHQKNAIAL